MDTFDPNRAKVFQLGNSGSLRRFRRSSPAVGSCPNSRVYCAYFPRSNSVSKAVLNSFEIYPASRTASPHFAQWMPNQSVRLIPVSASKRASPNVTPPLAVAVRVISLRICVFFTFYLCRRSVARSAAATPGSVGAGFFGDPLHPVVILSLFVRFRSYLLL